MSNVKWAVVAVTLLMGVANLGQVAQDSTAGWKVLGLVLGTVYTRAPHSAVPA